MFDESQEEQMKRFFSMPEWTIYVDKIRHEAKIWRILADQHGLDRTSREYLFAKAQGLEEAINKVEEWLNI